MWATALIVLGAASPSGHAQEFQQASENAKEEFKKADAELNAVYHQCLASGKLGPLAINALQSAQRLWVEYRDLNSTAYTAKAPDASMTMTMFFTPAPFLREIGSEN